MAFRNHVNLWVFGSVLVALSFRPSFAEDQHLTKKTRVDHDVAILSYARANQKCDGIEPPALYLEKPPAHGFVCVRPAKVKLLDAIVGNLTQCLGRTISGVAVYYFPRSRYVGSDELRYTVIFPERRYGTAVEMTVDADAVNSSDAGPAVADVGFTGPPQPIGPMPVCSPGVS